MKYLEPSFTVGPPAKSTACEACVYGRGEHAEWCEWRVRFVDGDGMRSYSIDPEKWRGLYGLRNDDYPQTGGNWFGIDRGDGR